MRVLEQAGRFRNRKTFVPAGTPITDYWTSVLSPVAVPNAIFPLPFFSGVGGTVF